MGDLRDAILSLSLLRQRPAAQDGTTRCMERKFLLCSESDGGFRILLGNTHLTAEGMERGSENQGNTQAKG